MKQVNLRIYRTILTLLLGLFLSAGAYAQQISVKGTVKDQTGEPVIGANVLVKGTTNGVITDVDGNFNVSADKNGVLVISFVGYVTQEVPVAEKQMVIVLKEDTELLDEVVVLGYGANTRKQDLSASVGVVSNTEELAARPVTSTEGMLQGVGYLLFVYSENPGEQKAERTRRNLALSVKIGWHHDHIRPGMANAMPGRFLFYGNHFCETKCSAGKRFRSNFNYEEETR